MVNYLYEALCKYFGHLCNTGYAKQSEVDKLLLLALIRKMVDCDFRGLIDKTDYDIINKTLYKLYGTSCLTPYPDYYNCKTKRIMYNCSISELVHRVERLERDGVPGGGPIHIDDKDIIVPGDDINEIDDIDIPQQ